MVFAWLILARAGRAANSTEAPARKAGMLYWQQEQPVGEQEKNPILSISLSWILKKKPQTLY
jgi:hypothetical protein